MPHRIILNPAEGMLTLKKLVGAGWPFAHSALQIPPHFTLTVEFIFP